MNKQPNLGTQKQNQRFNSLDRYTVVFSGNYTSRTDRSHWYLGMNSAPFHPQGIGQHGESEFKCIDRPTYSHLGKKIPFDSLPEDCKLCVMQTYLYLWDFTDMWGNTTLAIKVMKQNRSDEDENLQPTFGNRKMDFSTFK